MYYDTQDTHYKRVLNRILEVFNDYKNGIGSIYLLEDAVRSNIDALYNIDQQGLEEILGFVGHCQTIIYGEHSEMFNSDGSLLPIDEEEHRPTALKLIEKYEPLVHEALKADK